MAFGTDMLGSNMFAASRDYWDRAAQAKLSGKTVIGSTASTKGKATKKSGSKATSAPAAVDSGGASSGALKDTLAAAGGLDEYLRKAYDSALDNVLPGWKDIIAKTAAGGVSDVKQLAASFKTMLPGMIEKVNKVSGEALDVTSAWLRGEIPDDAAAVVRRNAAEVATQIGVRGQASQYLTARDLGLTSLDLMERGLKYSGEAAGIATKFFGDSTNILGAPIAAASSLGDLLGKLVPQPVNAAGLFNAILGESGVQSRFDDTRSDENYWNRINYSYQQRAASVAQSEVNANNRINQSMLDLARDTLNYQKNLVPVGTVGNLGGIKTTSGGIPTVVGKA